MSATPETEPAARTSSNGLAIASLVCGIVGLFIFQIVLGVLALIFGGIALNRASHGAGRRGIAWAGLILGAIDVILFIVLIAVSSSHGFSWHVGG